jgi:hypothetical protein
MAIRLCAGPTSPPIRHRVCRRRSLWGAPRGGRRHGGVSLDNPVRRRQLLLAGVAGAGASQATTVSSTSGPSPARLRPKTDAAERGVHDRDLPVPKVTRSPPGSRGRGSGWVPAIRATRRNRKALAGKASPVRWTDRGIGRMFWAGVGDQALSSAGFAMLGMPGGCRRSTRHSARGSRRPAGTLDVAT